MEEEEGACHRLSPGQFRRRRYPLTHIDTMASASPSHNPTCCHLSLLTLHADWLPCLSEPPSTPTLTRAYVTRTALGPAAIT